MSTLTAAGILILFVLFFAGVNAFGPLRQIAAWSDMGLFALLVILSAVWLRSLWRTARDRDAMRSLTMKLESANIRLSQLDRLKSEFLSFASHQIKAPMTVVKGYATLILDGDLGATPQPIVDTVAKIRASADRMIDLVGMFLDLRKLEEGKIEYAFETTDLGRMTTAIVDELRPLADAKHLLLTYAPPEDARPVRADVARLRQIIVNLIDNAIKYTEHGSVTVTVADGTKPGMVRVSVTDTGRGMSAELLPKLFEQFTRDVSVKKEIAGTGLGLYIAKQIAQAHDGALWASSAGPGTGSTFTLELPRS